MAPYGDLKCNNLIYETGSGDVTTSVSAIPGTTEMNLKANLAGPTFTGDVTLTGASYNVVFDASDNALEFTNNAKIRIGTNNDLELFSDGSDSYISNTTNTDLVIRNLGNAGINIKPQNSYPVTLNFNNSSKLTTTVTGIDVTGTAEVDGVDIAGPYKQTVVAITQSATPTVDLSTGNYFTLTQNANLTQWTFSNPPASRSFSFVIELANVSYTTAWTLASGTIKWPADTAPTLSASKTHLIILTTDDGGTTYRASSIVDYTT